MTLLALIIDINGVRFCHLFRQISLKAKRLTIIHSLRAKLTVRHLNLIQRNGVEHQLFQTASLAY